MHIKMKPDCWHPFWLGVLISPLLVFSAFLRLAGAASSQGTEFLVVFQEAMDGNNALYVTSDSDTEATVSVTFGGKGVEVFNVSRSTSVRVSVPAGMQMEGTLESADFTIYVNASHPVSVFAELDAEYTADATLVLPVSGLGRQYVLSTYTPSPNDKAQAVVVATEDQTQVQLYRDGLLLQSRNLSRHHAFQLQSTEDLMGTQVVADKPVAVFSGNIYPSVVRWISYDHLYSQLAAQSSWGSCFVTFPTTTASQGDVDRYRVVASRNSTKVKVTGQEEFALSRASQWREVNLSAHSLYFISSDQPVMVVKFVSGTTENSHPCMTPVVPVGQWSSSYSFRTPSSSSYRKSSDIWILSYSNETANILVNGENATTSGSFQCNLNVLDPNGREVKACSRRFDPDITVVLTSQPAVGFGAYVISFGAKVASCHALGMKLDAVTEACVATPSPADLQTETTKAAGATPGSLVLPSPSPAPSPSSLTASSSSPETTPFPWRMSSTEPASVSSTFSLSSSLEPSPSSLAAFPSPAPIPSSLTASSSSPEASSFSWRMLSTESALVSSPSSLEPSPSSSAEATPFSWRTSSTEPASVSSSFLLSSSLDPWPSSLAASPSLAPTPSSLTASSSSAQAPPFSWRMLSTEAASVSSSSSLEPLPSSSAEATPFSWRMSSTEPASVSSRLSLPSSFEPWPSSLAASPSPAPTPSSLTASSPLPQPTSIFSSFSSFPLSEGQLAMSAATSGPTEATPGTPEILTIPSLADPAVTSLQPTVLSSSGSQCSCTLRCRYNVTQMTSRGALSSAVERLQSELAVDARNVSATQRKLTSAPDRRTSSQVIGCVAVGVIAFIFGVIVLHDLPRLTRDFVQAVKRKPK